MTITREQVLRYRIHAQCLDARRGRKDCPVLDLGVQDTGPDGAAWALELRRCTMPAEDLVTAWTLRGAPHTYRRADWAAVAAATAPFSDTDAGKRIFDAAKGLRAADIGILDALAHVAGQLREIVVEPTVKGDVSTELTRRLDAPYLRHCRPCDATHSYEQTFRLAALQAGLELEPGTSPPVLRRIKGWRGPAKRVPDHLDVVRGVLHLLGPSTPALVAQFLDASVADVKRRWPQDVETVEVGGVSRDVLAADHQALLDPPKHETVRLLAPFDLFLQARDRELVVPEASARKDLWRVLGRPGAVLEGHEVVGSWRPRTAGGRLSVAITRWDGGTPSTAMAEQAERLADWRGVPFAGVTGSR